MVRRHHSNVVWSKNDDGVLRKTETVAVMFVCYLPLIYKNMSIVHLFIREISWINYLVRDLITSMDICNGCLCVYLGVSKNLQLRKGIEKLASSFSNSWRLLHVSQISYAVSSSEWSEVVSLTLLGACIDGQFLQNIKFGKASTVSMFKSHRLGCCWSTAHMPFNHSLWAAHLLTLHLFKLSHTSKVWTMPDAITCAVWTLQEIRGKDSGKRIQANLPLLVSYSTCIDP
jgi:hypothetical protein